eukprot:CAMPEP_0198577814 /NCGR_PEP_ID=MMETSP1462-20131121/119389_1 /TAXON_ID=1333877 /ORGANISM="Brandtodinium nutriculum, Strain RCC3387" /LENGTH=81 /DNA_ID=CAMNT_0044309097 /DNA_START=60 /DNA_END=302 /DNA_ORIENTATION=+
MATWASLVSPEQEASYIRNAAALLTVRCPQCDRVGSLWRDAAKPGDRLGLVQRVRDTVDPAAMRGLEEAWAEFVASRLGPD